MRTASSAKGPRRVMRTAAKLFFAAEDGKSLFNMFFADSEKDFHARKFVTVEVPAGYALLVSESALAEDGDHKVVHAVYAAAARVGGQFRVLLPPGSQWAGGSELVAAVWRASPGKVYAPRVTYGGGDGVATINVAPPDGRTVAPFEDAPAFDVGPLLDGLEAKFAAQPRYWDVGLQAAGAAIASNEAQAARKDLKARVEAGEAGAMEGFIKSMAGDLSPERMAAAAEALTAALANIRPRSLYGYWGVTRHPNGTGYVANRWCSRLHKMV
jgi:hypothetical protein